MTILDDPLVLQLNCVVNPWHVFSPLGPFKCYVTLFFWKLDPHPPPRNANNIEHYTFVTLFSRKSDTPSPHLHYITLEWPHFPACRRFLKCKRWHQRALCLIWKSPLSDENLSGCEMAFDGHNPSFSWMALLVHQSALLPYSKTQQMSVNSYF